MNANPAAPGIRSAAKAKTREKLLQAAVAILIEDGYAGFSMNKVAKRAGIAQPSFYAHFETTDQLLEGLAEDLIGRYLTPIQTTLNAVIANLNAAEAPALIQRLLLLAFNVVKSQQRLVRMVWSEREQRVSPFGERLRVLFIDIKQSWAKVLLEIGLVPNDVEHLLKLQLFMDSIFALFEAYASAWLDGRYSDEKMLAEHLSDYVLHYWQDEINAFFAQKTLQKNFQPNH